MEFQGSIKKDKTSSLWLAEIPALDLLTQGTSQQNAVYMIKDAVFELVRDTFSEEEAQGMTLDIFSSEKNAFRLYSNNNKLLAKLALKRQSTAN